MPSDSPPPAVSAHEHLPQIDLVLRLPVQGIGDCLSLVKKNNRSVFSGKPSPHPLAQLGQRHRISMPLVMNQLMIPFRENIQIIICGGAILHVLPFKCASSSGKMFESAAPFRLFIHAYPCYLWAILFHKHSPGPVHTRLSLFVYRLPCSREFETAAAGPSKDEIPGLDLLAVRFPGGSNDWPRRRANAG